jgi:hypothetical protein
MSRIDSGTPRQGVVLHGGSGVVRSAPWNVVARPGSSGFLGLAIGTTTTTGAGGGSTGGVALDNVFHVNAGPNPGATGDISYSGGTLRFTTMSCGQINAPRAGVPAFLVGSTGITTRNWKSSLQGLRAGDTITISDGNNQPAVFTVTNVNIGGAMAIIGATLTSGTMPPVGTYVTLTWTNGPSRTMPPSQPVTVTTPDEFTIYSEDAMGRSWDAALHALGAGDTITLEEDASPHNTAVIHLNAALTRSASGDSYSIATTNGFGITGTFPSVGTPVHVAFRGGPVLPAAATAAASGFFSVGGNGGVNWSVGERVGVPYLPAPVGAAAGQLLEWDSVGTRMRWAPVSEVKIHDAEYSGNWETPWIDLSQYEEGDFWVYADGPIKWAWKSGVHMIGMFDNTSNDSSRWQVDGSANTFVDVAYGDIAFSEGDLDDLVIMHVTFALTHNPRLPPFFEGRMQVWTPSWYGAAGYEEVNYNGVPQRTLRFGGRTAAHAVVVGTGVHV